MGLLDLLRKKQPKPEPVVWESVAWGVMNPKGQFHKDSLASSRSSAGAKFLAAKRVEEPFSPGMSVGKEYAMSGGVFSYWYDQGYRIQPVGMTKEGHLVSLPKSEREAARVEDKRIAQMERRKR